MKKLALLFAMVLGTINMFAQNIGDSFILDQLPLTSDDFQKFQFDYRLENASSVGFNDEPYSTNSGFDGIGIIPLEHNDAPVETIICTINDETDRGWAVNYQANAGFSSSGKIIGYSREIGSTGYYRFGASSWTNSEKLVGGLVRCVPNPYANWGAANKNSKGLIVSVGDDLKYKYDAQDRVIEVRYKENEYVYQYTYVGDSKKIKSIVISDKKWKRADVIYSYTEGKLSKVNSKLYNKYSSSYNKDVVEEEYEKTYKYNNKGDISEIKLLTVRNGFFKQYSFDNQYDSNGRIISSTVSKMQDSSRRPYVFTRKYTYDSKGNWTQIDQVGATGHKSFLNRKITYREKQNETVDINNIYDDEEVETHATFGSTIREALRKNGLSYDGNLWPYLGNLVINFRFVVARDGSVHVYDEAHTNKPNIEGAISNKVSDYIKSLPWAPATINGTFVNSTVLVSWKYNKTENSYSTEILKDVVCTDNEAKQFANFHRMKKEQVEAARGNLNDAITEEQSRQYREIWAQTMKYLDEANNAKYWYEYREPLKKADKLFETLQFKRNSGQMYNPELVQKYRNQIRESISSNTRMKFETTVLDPSNYEESDKSNETISNNSSDDAAFQVMALSWQLREKLEKGDIEAAKPIAESLYNKLKSSNSDKEKNLETEMVGYIHLAAFYESTKDNANIQSCIQKAINIAQKILKINPNNSTAKSVINDLNN
jgi:hypothetical protein